MLLSAKSFLNKKPSNSVGKYLTISHSHMTIFLVPLGVNILTELPQFFLSFSHGATKYLIVLVWWPNILTELPWFFFLLSPMEQQNILLSWYGALLA